MSQSNINIEKVEMGEVSMELKIPSLRPPTTPISTIKEYAEDFSSISVKPKRENWGWDYDSELLKSIHYFMTKKTFETAILLFRFAAFMKCIPFELESKTGWDSLRVQMVESRWKKWAWHGVNWIIFGVTAFEFLSFYFLWAWGEKYGKKMIFHIFYIMFILSTLLNYFSYIYVIRKLYG